MCAKLALLWHMHQPCYFDPQAGRYTMPWVFLHGAKDYREMLDLALERGGRVTFNFVPVLLDQLADYGRGTARDDFLDLVAKDPDHLTEGEKAALEIQLGMLHPENQARRYGRLHDLTGRLARPHRAGEAAGHGFKRGDWLDLETLYLLAWTGESTRARSPLLTALAQKGEGFGQEEKLSVLKELAKVCADTESAFRKAQEIGAVEISATPYCHPILPLLLDINSAKEAVPDIALPKIDPATFGDDAETQIKEAVIRHTEAFGVPPTGFWPSEGSVSPAALNLLAKHGAKWAATDEDILAASLGHPLAGPSRGELYRPYLYRTPSGPVNLFFRDKALSDLIGFVYSSWPARTAASDFVGRLKAIAAAHGPGAVITVVLDGENAWEHYPENGEAFLRELYTAVNASGEVEFATFSELTDPRATQLNTLRSGSWIYGSFTTWIGHQEKNRAWELLAHTRAQVTKKFPSLDEKRKKEVWEHLRIAEGSDWFWWLGDDHYTPLAGRFDELFRGRLAAVCRAMGEPENPALRNPIKRIGRRGLIGPPRGVLSPTIDGRTGSYFKWFDAGIFDLAFDAGSMHRTDSAFDTLHFGADHMYLYLRLANRALLAYLKSGLTLEVVEGPSETLVLTVGGEGRSGEGWAFDEAVEMALPLVKLARDGENRVTLAFRLLKDGSLLERAPLLNMAEFLPEADRNLGGWSV